MGGRGASSSKGNIEITYNSTNSFIGENLNEQQIKEIQNKATKYLNTLNLKDGNASINAESYAYQNQVDVLILPSTPAGTKGGTVQEAKYQERARISITNTTEEKKVDKKWVQKIPIW